MKPAVEDRPRQRPESCHGPHVSDFGGNDRSGGDDEATCTVVPWPHRWNPALDTAETR
jgi:hypothetical protein